MLINCVMEYANLMINKLNITYINSPWRREYEPCMGKIMHTPNCPICFSLISFLALYAFVLCVILEATLTVFVQQQYNVRSSFAFRWVARHFLYVRLFTFSAFYVTILLLKILYSYLTFYLALSIFKHFCCFSFDWLPF